MNVTFTMVIVMYLMFFIGKTQLIVTGAGLELLFIYFLAHFNYGKLNHYHYYFKS